MGVGVATAEFLIEAAGRGVRFDRTLTIGKQAVFVGPPRLGRLVRRHGLWPAGESRGDFYRRFRAEPGVLDPLLGVLGAREIASMDASPYENATVIHDLNQPIGDELRGHFSVVFDGGSLEHIFNAPVALRSYMEMVEVGGHLIIHTMANNYLGHGFYQFSPEFFFRALTPANGYEVERVVVVENDIAWRDVLGLRLPIESAGPWYEVADPEAVRSRVVLQNRRPVVIQVQARRIADTTPFAAAPQQSDYVELWTGDEEAGEAAPAGNNGLRARATEAMPPEVRSAIALDLIPRTLAVLNPIRFRREAAGRSLRNRRFYRRVHR
jgi:hypothetical protein